MATSTAAAARLKKITSKAKQIRKAHPSMTWQSAIKKAGKECRGKVSGVKKTAKKTIGKRPSRVGRVPAVRKKAAKKVGRVPSRVGKAPSRVGKTVGSMGDVHAQARESRRIIEGALGEFMARQYLATSKREKVKIGKKITELKSKLTAINRVIGKK